jgi:undecaprenyl-diphosphatase
MADGVLFVNPDAGRSASDDNELQAAFPALRVQPCDPADLAATAAAAADDGARVLGVCGGDGSISTVAQVARQHELTLLVVPGGTRNHFARDLGLLDVDTAAEAFASGSERHVDVGVVAEKSFVNNASLGSYVDLVQRREAHQRRWRKAVANVLAGVDHLRHGRKLTVSIDDETLRVWAVFIGNNTYGVGSFDFARRERLDEGLLDLRIIHAHGRFARLRATAALLLGRVERSPIVDQRNVERVTIDAVTRTLGVALDGETLQLPTPLEFTSARGALRVFAPPPES